MARPIGYKVSEETKQKIRLANLGKKKTYPIWNKGKTHIDDKRIRAGENHFSWKGGKAKHSCGYILITAKDHPFCNHQGYIFEHRLIMENYIGRYLYKGEIIHHKDGNKSNNDIKNLELITSNSKHSKYHYDERKTNKKGRFI